MTITGIAAIGAGLAAIGAGYSIVSPLFWNGNRRRTSLINLNFIL